MLPSPFPRTMGPNCMTYLEEVIGSGLTVDMCGRFEQAFAREHGVKHCIAAPGCTPALAILAAASGFDPGDEIIVSPFADYGTVMGLIKENYIPVFADTPPGAVNVSAETIEARITDRTRAVLVVHLAGLVCDMDPINGLAEKHGLLVFEDVCQAVFSQYKGRPAGTCSKAAAFSFDSEKTMGSDLGGCLVTNDDALAERARFIGHSRGAVHKPDFGREHTAGGYAYRMAQCTAAVTLAQLEIIRDQVIHRDRMARLLTERIAEVPGVTPLPIPEYQDVYSCWLIGMTVETDQFRCAPDEFASQLAEAGIPGAGMCRYYLMPPALRFLDENARNRIYPFSMPPASREYRYGPDTCPTAWQFAERWIRWFTFCEKYSEEHCELAADIVRRVADNNRL